MLSLPGGIPATIGQFAGDYNLSTAEVDVKLARALYNNTDVRYKLGAGFAKPVINVPAGFMGQPLISAVNNSKAQESLDRVLRTWQGSIIRAHRNMLRDGEVLLRVYNSNRSPAYAALFEGAEPGIDLEYNLAESFEIETVETDFLSIQGIRVKHLVVVHEKMGGVSRSTQKVLYEMVYPDKVIWEWDNDYRPRKEFVNPLGFVNAVYLKNESDPNLMHGTTDLEPLEPYFKFYNDVMLHAGSASQLHSTAKLVLRVQDVARFIQNNFDQVEINEKRLRFKGKDVLFFESGAPEIGVTGGAMFEEGADIIQARAPLGDTNTLLEYIFLNIVDTSEVPEWAFGGAIASSKASVTEQSAPLIHKTNRKRGLVENDWAMIGRMALKMLGNLADVTVSWDELAQKDSKAEAEALKVKAEALIALNDAGMVSKKTAVAELRPFLETLLEYSVDEGDDEKTRLDEETEDVDFDLIRELGGDADDDDRTAGLRVIR